MNQNDSLYEEPSDGGNPGLRIILGLVPLLIILGLVALAIAMKVFAPTSERRKSPKPPALMVEILNIKPINYQVIVESYGTVQPRTQSMLLAQVSGQVTAISPRLREGGFFEMGDMLLTIDQRDYKANVEIAKATLTDAGQSLAEEQARSNQASADWSRLGNLGVAPDLVLRKPQLSAANARVASAQSQLDKAMLNLERTSIKAPYAGRVRTKGVDVGQVVNPNTMLAQVYATDYIEVRLPLRDKDLPFVALPEKYRADVSNGDDAASVPVRLFSSLVDKEGWDGKIVRTESAIDAVARQLHCVAQIEDPFGEPAVGRTPLKIGEYVTAQIQGRVLSNAIVVPTSAIYQSAFTYVVQNGQLQQRGVNIVWQNDTDAIIDQGLSAGDQLIITPLGQVTSGTAVRVIDQDRVPDDAPTTAGKKAGPGIFQGSPGSGHKP